MKFIKLDLPRSVFSSEGKRNSFYEDALPDEQIKIVGAYFSPVFSNDSDKDTSGD